MVHLVVPGFSGFPLWNERGLWHMLLLHAGPTEFVYYWFHRALHHHSLYKSYHSHHHSSFVTEAITGSVHPFVEHLGYTANFAIPLVGTWALGTASVSMFYIYFLAFDFLNAMGHCNFEFIPSILMKVCPWLKYLIYTPSFHSLHHSHVHTNFCLFMPIYDYIYGTVDRDTDETFEKAREGRKGEDGVVFVGHGTELLSFFHLPMWSRAYASRPYKASWVGYLLSPLLVPAMVLLWFLAPVFVGDRNRLKKLNMQTWVVPRFGFQYFLPYDWVKRNINGHLMRAILKADRIGIDVIGLGALNKAEYLNKGGQLFLDSLPKGQDLRVRLVHGNTLTAAVVIHEIPEDAKEVVLTGSTSKLGRAIALYLVRRGVKVFMLTSSRERYERIRDEAAKEHRGLLVHITEHAQGSHCARWIVGTRLTEKQQSHAPRGTHFHQFVVPTIPECRDDVVYGKLAAIQLPKEVRMKWCEMTMKRNNVHACHAGAILHALEKWKHHEVGAIDVERIDVCWESAAKYGFVAVQ